MNILDKIKEKIANKINKALGSKIVQASDLVYPPKPEMGDLSLPCFKIKIRPGKIAEEVLLMPEISGVKWAGPYLNFRLSKEKLAQLVIREVGKQKDKYGENAVGKGKRVMIEYSNANTHKEYHVGHLRNITYGDAVSRILSANGFKLIPVSYINDFGIHAAKTLWAYLSFYKDKKLPADKGEFLGKVYARSVKEMEKDPLAKEKVFFMMRKIESRQGEEYKLWQKTRQWSIEAFSKIHQELGVKFTHTFYESEFIEAGLKKVSQLYKKGFLTKSEGAVIKDLGEFNLGALLFLRSDGSALYPVADMPLAIEKFKKYKLDASIYVVDNRQSLYFKQLFKVMELLGFKQSMIHLKYDFVKLPSGAMSSRLGNVISYNDLRALVYQRAREETKKRHQDWSKRKLDKTVNAIVNSALKFEMLKVGAGQIITFDINQALRFDGFTAAYLQYTYARINSIIKKSKNNANPRMHANTANLNYTNIKYDKLTEKKEHVLVLELAKFNDIVLKAGENYDPSLAAKYLFDLARIFNDYYHKISVLKAEKDVREARLALILSISQVIKNGLNLLGIETVNEM
ncbi:MAG: arginine--tRNA ligase [Patescibacteria group bacterium]|nr:arginine--tRNA ligase [Patescibacteria group bacterium]